jgi:uncharacterized membrane protein YbhN (UPF0104 family)
VKRPLWSLVVLVLVVVAIAWYVLSRPDLLGALKQVSVWAAVYLLATRFLFLGLNGLVLRDFVARFEVRLTPKEWFGLSVMTTMGNYITPLSGGMVARAAYLKHEHKLPYAQFATLLASSYLVSFWVVGIVGAAALLVSGTGIQPYWEMFVFFVTVTLSITALVLLPVVELSWENRVARAVNASLEGWKLVRSDGSLLVRLVILTLLNLFLNGASLWVAYYSLSSQIPFGTALLIGLLTSFSLLIRITPGNLGIQEAVVSLSSGLLGTGADEGLLAALLLRAATLVWAFTLGPVFAFLLTRRAMGLENDASPHVFTKEQEPNPASGQNQQKHCEHAAEES